MKDTWNLSKLPKGHEAIKVQWTFEFKKKVDEKKVEVVHVKTQDTRRFHFSLSSSRLKMLQD